MTDGLGEWQEGGEDPLAAPAAPTATANGAATPGATDAVDLYYPNVLVFVTEHLSPMYRRALTANTTTWCPEWWKHAEGIARLEALWRAWEHLRLDPATGSSVWFRDHCDHHMAVLLNADGPFKGCKPDKHAERMAPLPLHPPPPGLF